MKTRFLYIFSALVLLPSIVAAQRLLGPDSIFFDGRVSGVPTSVDFLLSNPGNTVISTGVPFIVPSGSPFALIKNTLGDFLPKEERWVGLKYEPTESGCDTAYLHIPFSIDSELVIVLSGCSAFSGITEDQSTALGISIYPNPFNSQTVISVTNASSRIKASIADIHGTIFLLPGSDRIIVDAKEFGLTAGTYILRIEDGDKVLTKNIILLK